MTNEIISILVGAVAPFILKGLSKLGLEGVAMLWVSYAVAIALAIGTTFATGQFEVGDVAKSVTVIVAISQTIFHTFKEKLKA